MQRDGDFQSELLDQLEQMKVRAKRGELHGFIFIAWDGNGDAITWHAIPPTIKETERIGALELFKLRMAQPRGIRPASVAPLANKPG